MLQQDSSHTLYGIALRVWSRADEKRADTIRELRRKTEPDFYDNAEETYWIPYCLSFLSRYPLYNLLGDYLRGMWIHWNKATNLFHAEEVSRILSFPAPRLNDLVRIDMKDYALCYQFPSSPTGFQNFALWPLFTCLSIPNIVGVIEAAVSPTRRIIFVSHYAAMLTVAAETIRFCTRVYEWSGLYCPVVHARHIKDLVQEPGPYILGATAECRTAFTAPSDALVIDLDRNFVLTSSPPNVLTAGQRTKMITRLTQALNGDVAQTGVPPHLRSAFGGGKLIPAGQIIVMRGEVETVEDPDWWNQDAVMAVMDHVCEKLGRNTGVRALFGGAIKKPLMTKVSMRHLNEIVRERNQYSRDAVEAWQDFINLKGRMDTELSKVTKRNNFLVEELDTWKQQFLKFQAFAEQLTKETSELKVKIEGHKRENRRLLTMLEQHKDEINRLTLRLTGTEKQRDDALEALVLQQEIAEELERERKRNAKEISALEHTTSSIMHQRDEAQRVVIHLRSLINGQAHHMQHIIRSLEDSPELNEYLNEEDETFDEAEEELPRQFEPRTGASSRAGTRSPEESVERHGRQSRHDKDRSRLSMSDVADRYLRDKTDAIADIIRGISEQCAAAVEGLHMAQDADQYDVDDFAANGGTTAGDASDGNRKALLPSDAGESSFHDALAPDQASSTGGDGDGEGDSAVADRSSTSIPPTPDLVHGNRSSTSMSTDSRSTADRSSLQWQQQYSFNPGAEIPTRIVEDDGEEAHERDAADEQVASGPGDQPVLSKRGGNLIVPPARGVVS